MSQKLSRNTTFLLMIGCLFNAGLVIAATFVNVYLLRLTSNMGLMILQNIANNLMIVIGFVIGTQYTQKGGRMLNLLRVGITSVILYYALVLFLKEKASDYLIILGLFNGIGQGFYYFTFNILVGKLLKAEERSKFFSYQSSFSYIFGVIAPAVSGYIIVKFTELTGYYVLFATAVFVFILAIFFSLELRKVEVHENYSILPVLKEKGNKYWNIKKYISFTYALREVIYAQIYTVVAYLIISNEAIIGNLSSIMSLVGVLSSLLIASKFTPQTHQKYHLYYCLGYLISLGCLGIFSTPWSLYLSFVINGLIIPWCNVIYSSHTYQLASLAATKYTNSDYIVVSEFHIAVGRILGLLLFYVLNLFIDSFILYRILLVSITFLPLLDHFVLKKQTHWIIE